MFSFSKARNWNRSEAGIFFLPSLGDGSEGMERWVTHCPDHPEAKNGRKERGLGAAIDRQLLSDCFFHPHRFRSHLLLQRVLIETRHERIQLASGAIRYKCTSSYYPIFCFQQQNSYTSVQYFGLSGYQTSVTGAHRVLNSIILIFIPPIIALVALQYNVFLKQSQGKKGKTKTVRQPCGSRRQLPCMCD